VLNDTTLVLGGGGLWGVAWMTGLLMGLEESDLDVRHPRAVIGTSAGSVVGAHVTSGLSTQELFERQVDPHRQARQNAPDAAHQAAAFGLFGKPWSDPNERLAAICDLALNTPTISWEQRRADIVERLSLPSTEWPSTSLSITAVDVDTRELRTFDADSGIDLVDAIAASCAVPGVWPIAPIGGRRYIDGGVWRTAENAHLAAEAQSVLILSPFGRAQAERIGGGSTLDGDVAALRAGGARVILITANQSSLASLSGRGALDPGTRKPGAEAGRIQGQREAAALKGAFQRIGTGSFKKS
jgi:NTE family protein